jgi:hypothetical protein
MSCHMIETHIFLKFPNDLSCLISRYILFLVLPRPNNNFLVVISLKMFKERPVQYLGNLSRVTWSDRQQTVVTVSSGSSDALQ